MKKSTLQEKTLTFCVFFAFYMLNLSTVFSATIKGTLEEKQTGDPLFSANISIYDMDDFEQKTVLYGAVTNIDGDFEIQNIKAGKYILVGSYIGYSSSAKQIQIEKEDVFLIDILLKNDFIWDPIIIQTTVLPNTINETLLSKSPATYDDVARAFLQKLSLVNTNDQSNSISVRGNSPNGLKWFLNGIEIPNPNHTPNAGTARDRVTYSGGGVNMLKPEFMSSTRFSYNESNNSLGGQIFTNVQSYNPRKTTIKLGLIGLEAMHSQPFNNNKGNVFASFRYSTFGLLTDLIGLDFGGEAINYIDYNINANFRTQKFGDFQLFSVFGTSSNVFTTQRDTSLWEESKDQFDINFKSQTTINGISNKYRKGNSELSTTLAYSTWNTTRTGTQFDNDFSGTLLENDSLAHQRFSFFTAFTNKNNFGESTIQLHGRHQTYALSNFDSLLNYSAKGQLSGLILEPSIGHTFKFLSTFKSKIELGALYSSQTNEFSLQPSFSLRNTFSSYVGKFIEFNYSLRNQTQTPDIYLSRNQENNLINSQIAFSKAHHFDLTYASVIKNSPIKAILYYQSLYDIPIINQDNSSFSVINEFQTFITDTLSNTGTGQNYGLELSYEYKNGNGDFYISSNGALYNSTYTSGDGIERSTRFNGNFILNIVAGKEWDANVLKVKKEVDKKIGVYVRGLYAGGLRETPIDETLSAQLGRTVYIENQAFSLSQGNIFKIDARFYWQKSTRNREGSILKTHTIAFDIQNLTNQKNVGFRYYDTIQGQVATKYQLGLIPLLTWKVEF